MPARKSQLWTMPLAKTVWRFLMAATNAGEAHRAVLPPVREKPAQPMKHPAVWTNNAACPDFSAAYQVSACVFSTKSEV
jgi:hypothetical protein